jgi:hypothetical protein
MTGGAGQTEIPLGVCGLGGVTSLLGGLNPNGGHDKSLGELMSYIPLSICMAYSIEVHINCK